MTVTTTNLWSDTKLREEMMHRAEAAGRRATEDKAYHLSAYVRPTVHYDRVAKNVIK